MIQEITYNKSFAKQLPQLAYNRDEVAKMLGVSVITVDRLTKRGFLRPSRAIRKPLYSKSELERFLAETSETISA